MPISKWKRLLWGVVLGLLSLMAISEIICYTSFLLAPSSPKAGNCAVLVLGYPSENDGTPSPVQELRVKFGVKTYRQNSCSVIVFSGSAVANKIVEAQTMSKLAVKLGAEPKQIIQEARALNTWENIKYSIPLVEKYNIIFIVSDTIHPYRGRRYLCKQRSDVCNRAFVIVSYKPFSLLLWKVGAVSHEVFAWIRDFIFY